MTRFKCESLLLLTDERHVMEEASLVSEVRMTKAQTMIYKTLRIIE